MITAMKIEDYEKAAAHMHRFLLIDEATLKLTAGDVAQGKHKTFSECYPQFLLQILFSFRPNSGQFLVSTA